MQENVQFCSHFQHVINKAGTLSHSKTENMLVYLNLLKARGKFLNFASEPITVYFDVYIQKIITRLVHNIKFRS